jgi:hypothetical protein
MTNRSSVSSGLPVPAVEIFYLTPPKPPKVTGLRNILQHFSDESEDEASPSNPRYSPRKETDSSDSDTSDDSDSDSEHDSVIMSPNTNHDDEYVSDVELIL